jgi:hypothetical protein
MSPTILVSEETVDDLDSHRKDGESYDELLGELVRIYEQQEAFTREGYSE